MSTSQLEEVGTERGRYRLTGKERVRKKEDLRRLVHKGIRYHSAQYTLVVAKNGLELVRIATSVKRKLGKAATRNYEKRVVKECFRREKVSLPKGYDLLVIVKHETDDFAASCGALTRLLRRSLN